jgi:hypothetical protein
MSQASRQSELCSQAPAFNAGVHDLNLIHLKLTGSITEVR